MSCQNFIFLGHCTMRRRDKRASTAVKINRLRISHQTESESFFFLFLCSFQVDCLSVVIAEIIFYRIFLRSTSLFYISSSSSDVS